MPRSTRHKCVRCDPKGALHELSIDQRAVSTWLGGTVGFVGGIPEVEVYIVGRVDLPPTVAVNPLFDRCPHAFHEPPRGTLVFIGSDAEGAAQDVDVRALLRTL